MLDLETQAAILDAALTGKYAHDFREGPLAPRYRIDGVTVNHKFIRRYIALILDHSEPYLAYDNAIITDEP